MRGRGEANGPDRRRPGRAGLPGCAHRLQQCAHHETLGGARTVVAVPMLKERELVGAVVIYRQEVRPFTDKQIELVSDFAKQAIIAIENAEIWNGH